MRHWLSVLASLLGVIVAAAVMFPGRAAPQATPQATAQPEDIAIIRHLNAAITWYKQLTSVDEAAGLPSDAFYLDNARGLARQALLLAFQSADAEAALLLTEKGGDAGAGTALSTEASDQRQNVAKAAAAISNQISQAQAQIEILDSQIATASGKNRQGLISKRENWQEQLDFDKARQEALQKLSTFTNTGAGKAGGLQKEVENLKKSVPDLFAKAPAAEAAPTASSPPAASPEGSGLISQGSVLFSRLENLRMINQLIGGAAKVSEMARQLQTPLRAKLHITIEQGSQLANQLAPQNAGSIEASRQKMTSLTAQFKQISNATIPLTQEIVLLEESQSNLQQWENSVHRGYTQILTSFLTHVSILLIGIGFVVVISELWRRATFRYALEARRRHQLLLLRYIVTGLLLAIVLTLGFVSEFSSLATFAGFLTAGLAVALQTVLLSVAGYFFLIGRHGVMVGDRISVSGVTGEVIDVGLVRLYLTELAGTGSDLHPTGRVVVISNSVLFLGVPFFKQIPGTAYSWHEVAVKLERGSNYALAESTLLEAVNSVYSQYRESIEQQHQAVRGLMAISPVVPSPHARFQLVENGLDLVVRYPVVLTKEWEVDHQMARKVEEVINGNPELKAAAGLPTIRATANA
ncbi:MAG: mechanosensitive ion channel [Acidobacteriota bacterium]|nr:mechanosensitive ion channel [Acidobacteriota bacterium]